MTTVDAQAAPTEPSLRLAELQVLVLERVVNVHADRRHDVHGQDDRQAVDRRVGRDRLHAQGLADQGQDHRQLDKGGDHYRDERDESERPEYDDKGDWIRKLDVHCGRRAR